MTAVDVPARREDSAAPPARTAARRGLDWRRLGRSGPAAVGTGLVLLALASALFAPALAPAHPGEAVLWDRLRPPSWLPATAAGATPPADVTPRYYWLGADPVGRDLLSRIIYGARVSLFVGVVAVAISVLLGVVLGLLSGYYGGVLDDLLMRIADVQLAFPFILLAITVMAVFGSGLWKLVLVMGIGQWVGYARVVRGQVLSIRELDYVQAARALGVPNRLIIGRHIFPNLVSSVIVLATLNIATNILIEAGLTFLGLGVDPTIPSWGGMLADGRNYVATAWWVATFPGLAIMLTVLGFNMLGDWLRDELDPQLRF